MPAYGQQSTSLCIAVDGGCFVQGARVTATLDVGPTSGGALLVGGHTTIQYDPSQLAFVSIAPGTTCDAGSPFSQELAESVDTVSGTIAYDVGVDIGDPGTSGPTTLACVIFRVMATGASSICLSGDPGLSQLITAGTADVDIDNTGLCDAGGNPTVSCAQVDIATSCQCGVEVPDCSLLTDACNTGVCVEGTPAHCAAITSNEGAPCDDGYECTTNETCVAGTCAGTDCAKPSVCIEVGGGCLTRGGVNARVELGESDSVIVGAQLYIEYDPTVLTLSSISPGITCNPSSPFSVEIFEVVDDEVGSIFYAVGRDPLDLDLESNGLTTLACLSFTASGAVEDEICLTAGTNPFKTLLSDINGDAVTIYNLDTCGADVSPPALSCGDVFFDENCLCTPGTSDCSALNTACQVGVCNPDTGSCESMPSNEGGPCDDGDTCTTEDICQSGRCVGSGCTEPSLCVIAQEECTIPGQPAEVTIRMGASSKPIVGGQFVLEYDSAALQLIDIVPGHQCDTSSPFTEELIQNVDNVNGTAFYGVLTKFGEPGTFGPATLACAVFEVVDYTKDGICLHAGANPTFTLLVSETGQAVHVHSGTDCPTNKTYPLISCDDFCIPVPAVSGWGIVVLTLLFLTAAKFYFGMPSREHPRSTD